MNNPISVPDLLSKALNASDDLNDHEALKVLREAIVAIQNSFDSPQNLIRESVLTLLTMEPRDTWIPEELYASTDYELELICKSVCETSIKRLPFMPSANQANIMQCWLGRRLDGHYLLKVEDPLWNTDA